MREVMRGNFQGHIIEGKFAHEGSYVEKTLFSRNLSSCGQGVNIDAPFRPRFLYAGYKKTAWNQAVCGGVKWARTIDLYDVNVTL